MTQRTGPEPSRLIDQEDVERPCEVAAAIYLHALKGDAIGNVIVLDPDFPASILVGYHPYTSAHVLPSGAAGEEEWAADVTLAGLVVAADADSVGNAARMAELEAATAMRVSALRTLLSVRGAAERAELEEFMMLVLSRLGCSISCKNLCRACRAARRHSHAGQSFPAEPPIKGHRNCLERVMSCTRWWPSGLLGDGHQMCPDWLVQGITPLRIARLPVRPGEVLASLCGRH